LEPVEIFASHAFMTYDEEKSSLLRQASKTNIGDLFEALKCEGKINNE
jgi:hypothetical protein